MSTTNVKVAPHLAEPAALPQPPATPASTAMLSIPSTKSAQLNPTATQVNMLLTSETADTFVPRELTISTRPATWEDVLLATLLTPPIEFALSPLSLPAATLHSTCKAPTVWPSAMPVSTPTTPTESASLAPLTVLPVPVLQSAHLVLLVLPSVETSVLFNPTPVLLASKGTRTSVSPLVQSAPSTRTDSALDSASPASTTGTWAAMTLVPPTSTLLTPVSSLVLLEPEKMELLVSQGQPNPAVQANTSTQPLESATTADLLVSPAPDPHPSAQVVPLTSSSEVAHVTTPTVVPLALTPLPLDARDAVPNAPPALISTLAPHAPPVSPTQEPTASNRQCP